jgi:hypothetical protein
MKNSKFPFILFLACLALIVSSCAKPLYYYKNVKRADEKAFDNHKENLISIIAKSEQKKTRVPPGVYAELGFLFLPDDGEAAGRYFQLEMETYPESTQLMKVLIDNLK